MTGMTSANAPISDLARTAQDQFAQRPELLALLASVSQDFAASPAMEATLANATKQIMAYMETEAVSIFLLDETGEHLTCLACAGPVSIEGLTLD